MEGLRYGYNTADIVTIAEKTGIAMIVLATGQNSSSMSNSFCILIKNLFWIVKSQEFLKQNNFESHLTTH